LRFVFNVGVIDPLAMHLVTLLNKKKFSDCQFQCEDAMFYGHKAILGCRSEKFKLMFTSGFKEATDAVITLDVPPSVSLLQVYLEMTNECFVSGVPRAVTVHLH